MIKKHVKTFLCTFCMGILLAGSLLTLFSFLFFSRNGIEFKNENIDDAYGKLSTNTKIILEDSIKNAMETKNTEFFFSYVYEDLNENYIKNLSLKDKAVFIYYNDTTKELNTISKLKINGNNFRKILTGDKDLDKVIPNYINSICENMEGKTNQIYSNNLRFITSSLIFVFIVFFITFFSNIGKYVKYIKNYLYYLKVEKQNKEEEKKNKLNSDDNVHNNDNTQVDTDA